MKITLTGAAGRLGTHVCRALVEAGHEVRAVDQVARAEFLVKMFDISRITDETGWEPRDEWFLEPNP